jgi:hypothetical protein
VFFIDAIRFIAVVFGATDWPAGAAGCRRWADMRGIVLQAVTADFERGRTDCWLAQLDRQNRYCGCDGVSDILQFLR